MIFKSMQQKVNNLLPKILTQPFNQELSQGTLPLEKFIFYLKQDALYLADFSRALSMTAARLPHLPHSQQFMHFATQAIQAERELHAKHLTTYKVPAFTADDQSPACFMYTNYLLKITSTGAVEEAVASLLPCFWVYREVGKHLAQQAIHTLNNPYQDWIALYSSEQFDVSVNAAIAITNELAENISEPLKNKMLVAFVRSTQLEWLFWDSAYRQEEWAIH